MFQLQYFLVLLALFFPYTFCSNCFKCHRSNYKDCETFQKSINCGPSSKCYSLNYFHDLKKSDGSSVEEHGFKKGCVNLNADCQSYCRRYIEHGYKGCKVVSCCDGDNCNTGFRDTPSNKNKRSFKETSGKSSAYKDHANKLLVFTLGIAYILFKNLSI